MACCEHHHESVPALLERCKAEGLRRTQALEEVLNVLQQSKDPLSLSDLSQHPTLLETCDPATIYRLLQRLEDKGLLRRLGLRDRSTYYVIKYSQGGHHDYLICKNCGHIQTLDYHCPAEALEKDIAQHTGYAALEHELEFFGICPDCQGKA